MQELIDKLKTEVGLTEEQAKQAIETIKNFVIDNQDKNNQQISGLHSCRFY